MTDHFLAVVELTKQLKRRLPNIPIVWGGIHPTLVPESCSSYADYVCVGEGYEATYELLHQLNEGERFPDISGIGYLRANEFIFHGVREPIDDIDILPFVDYGTDEQYLRVGNSIRPMTSSLMKRYMGFWYTSFFSYGCPFNCTYCCNSYLHKLHPRYRSIRKHSPEYVADEIKFIRRVHPFIRMVKFNDDSFMSLSDSEMARFADLQNKIGNIPFVATGGNPRLITEQKIALLVGAGLRRTRIGIQTGNERVLRDVYGRKPCREDILRSSRILARYSRQLVPTAYDIILDNPWEKPEELIDTFDLISQLERPFSLNLFSLRPYPKTVLYDRVVHESLMDVTEMREGKVKSFLALGNSYLNCLIAASGLIPIPRGLRKFLLNQRFVQGNRRVPRPVISTLTTMITMQKVYHHISKRDVTMLPFSIARML
jgi:radical SAM superfamily enzyme YgiQ (UPF0313 family)